MSALPSLREIAKALDGEVAGPATVRAPGPNHSARDRSLAVKIDAAAPDGFLVHSFASDDWRACRDHVRQRLGFPEWQPGDGQNRSIPLSKIDKWDLACVSDEAEDRRSRNEEEAVRIEQALRIWNNATDPRGTLAEKYLNSRSLDLTSDLAGRVLRFHSQCPWRNEDTGRTDRVPALIAVFRSISDNSITAIHRTALNRDGSKIARRMLGIVQSAAIKLDPAEGETLAIGEGIETCMAARQLGFKPAWALGSVGAISFFPVIDGVGRLQILGEAGAPSARSTRICGTRWHKAGRRVQIVIPTVGSDLNDTLLLGESRA